MLLYVSHYFASSFFLYNVLARFEMGRRARARHFWDENGLDWIGLDWTEQDGMGRIGKGRDEIEIEL